MPVLLLNFLMVLIPDLGVHDGGDLILLRNIQLRQFVPSYHQGLLKLVQIIDPSPVEENMCQKKAYDSGHAAFDEIVHVALVEGDKKHVDDFRDEKNYVDEIQLEDDCFLFSVYFVKGQCIQGLLGDDEHHETHVIADLFSWLVLGFNVEEDMTSDVQHG